MAVVPADVLDCLRPALAVEPALSEVVGALSMAEVASGVMGGGRSPERDGLMRWVCAILSMLGSLEPTEREGWEAVRRALAAVGGSVEQGERGLGGAALLEMFNLADLVDICGHANRAAPYARDMVKRLFFKSVHQRRFFGDVRMSRTSFNELVSMTWPFLRGTPRGPCALDPTYRILAVLFWLSQGGRQRVIARCIYVAESTLEKYVRPVVAAMLCALPPPRWPDAVERRVIGTEFAQMKGGNLSGWTGLYVWCMPSWRASRYVRYSMGHWRY